MVFDMLQIPYVNTRIVYSQTGGAQFEGRINNYDLPMCDLNVVSLPVWEVQSRSKE